jgi:hypothetical protein
MVIGRIRLESKVAGGRAPTGVHSRRVSRPATTPVDPACYRRQPRYPVNAPPETPLFAFSRLVSRTPVVADRYRRADRIECSRRARRCAPARNHRDNVLGRRRRACSGASIAVLSIAAECPRIVGG